MRQLNSDDRHYMKTKLDPQHWIRRVVMGAFITLGIVGAIARSGPWDGLIVFILGCSFFDFFLTHRERGYQLSYDGARIYMRPGGCRWNFRYYPETSIAFDDIELVCSDQGRDPGGLKARFGRFDHIRIYGDIDISQWEPLGKTPFDFLMIIPDQLIEAEGLGLLDEIYRRRPEAFEADLVEFVESGKSWR